MAEITLAPAMMSEGRELRPSELPARMQRDDAAGQLPIADAAEAGRLDHRGKSLRLRKFTDGLDEVLIRFAVAGDHLADARDSLEGIELVQPVEPGHVDSRKFKAQETAADLEHPIGLRQRALDARHVADAEGDGDAVEALVGIG